MTRSISPVQHFGCGVLAICMSACGATTANPQVSQLRHAADGQLALSGDGALLYAVSPDDDSLVVVDRARLEMVATVQVGHRPARVVVGPDENVYVSNRSSRSVSVIRRGQWGAPTQIAVGAEPVGLALSADGKSLLVANQGSATLQAFDLGQSPAALRWQTALSDLPRGVAALPDGRIYVSHFRSGLVDVLDAAGKVQKSVSASVGTAPALNPGVGGSVSGPAFTASALDSIVVAHDGQRAYFAHSRERTGLVSAISAAPIVAPAITTFELAGDYPHDEALEQVLDFPPTVVVPDVRSIAGFGGSVYYAAAPVSPSTPWIQGPVAALEDPTGVYLYLANQNSNDLTVLRTHVRADAAFPSGIVANVPVGAGPSGLALSPDGKTLYVLNALEHSLSVVQATSASGLAEQQRIQGIGSSGTLSFAVQQGRQLFYGSNNPQMSIPGAGVACESCHLEGGTDGTTWQFVWGPRKTMGLLGKNIGDTAPFHWDGTEPLMHDLLENTIQKRLGGTGLDPQGELDVQTFMAGLTAFDNPNVLPGGLTAQQQRGQALFASNCQSCHAGRDFTDNGFHDVGTRVTQNPNPAGRPDDLCRLGLAGGPNADLAFSDGGVGQGCLSDNGETPIANPANVGVGGFNTPTLLGVFGAGPYFHDGSAQTLDAAVVRMMAAQNKPALPADQVADLVSYLQTL